MCVLGGDGGGGDGGGDGGDGDGGDGGSGGGDGDGGEGQCSASAVVESGSSCGGQVASLVTTLFSSHGGTVCLESVDKPN